LGAAKERLPLLGTLFFPFAEIVVLMLQCSISDMIRPWEIAREVIGSKCNNLSYKLFSVLSRKASVKPITSLVRIYSAVATNDYISGSLARYQGHENMEHLECIVGWQLVEH
jgi:hypothetical protein